MNLEEYARLLPAVTEENKPYWDGAEAGELRLQSCSKCGTFRFPDSPVCPNCLSAGFDWKALSGRGTLWSWIVMHQRYFEAFADEVPYPVAFIKLEEGPFLMSTVIDDVGDLVIDHPVEVLFDRLGERSVPRFRLSR